MSILLLVAALFLAAPQGNDPALSRSVLLQAFDRQAELDHDSALVLFRAARDADLFSLVAHLEYIYAFIAREKLPHARLAAEYDQLPDTPTVNCLRAYVGVSGRNLPAAVPALLEMERRGEGGSCVPVLLARVTGDLRPGREWGPIQLSYLEEALALEPGIAWLWTSSASVLAAAGRPDEAEAALRLAARSGRFPPALNAVFEMRRAGLMRARGDTSAARALWRGVRIAVERDGRPGVLLAYLRELDAVTDTRNTNDSPWGEVLRQIADLAARHGDWMNEYYPRHTLGRRLTDRGEPAAALENLDRTVAIADSVQIPRYQVEAHYKRGRALRSMGRLDNAEADLLQAVKFGKASEGRYYLAEAYHNLFHLYDDSGRADQAAEAVKDFGAAISPLSHSPLQMTAALDAAEFNWKMGWHAAANEAFLDVVRVIDAQDENHSYAGQYYERTGDLRRARDYFQRGLEASAPSDAGRSQNLAGLARVYLALAQLDSAEVYARQHDEFISGPTDLPLLPEVLSVSGRNDEAVAAARAWLAHRSEGGSVRAIVAASLRLAELLIQDEAALLALPVLDRADSLVHLADLTAQSIEALRIRGVALAASGDTAAAVRALREAATNAAEHPSSSEVRDAHVALGEVLAAVGQVDEALRAFVIAAEQVESTTQTLDADFDRVRYGDRNMAPYDGAIAAILSRPESSEQHRDLLHWSGRRKAATLAAATSGQPSAAPAWTADPPSLDSRSVLVDYTVLGDATVALVLRGSEVSVYRLATAPDVLSDLTRDVIGPMASRTGGAVDMARMSFDSTAALALYRAVWEPLSGALAAVSHVTISPDGPLHRVPFAALMNEAEGRPSFLIEAHEIDYVLSPWDLVSGSEVGHSAIREGARLFAVSFEAPGSDQEIAAITPIWPGPARRLSSAEATETAVLGSEAGYQVVHYAAHAVADDRDPLASYIRLAPDARSDGLLHLSEIAATGRDQDLVVLSGCETQSGELYRGSGLMGLTRGFLVSGVRSVVATQWPIGAATAPLMEEFYRRLAAGEDASAALRRAQLQVRSDPATAHPFYWAGFVLHRRD